MLGLCPLLAVSTSMVNAVSLGLATILVMALANWPSRHLRSFIPYEIRIPVFILIIAALVTVVDLAFNAWLHDLYLVLGIFIPLIVTNCIVLARVEAFAAKNPAGASTMRRRHDGHRLRLGHRPARRDPRIRRPGHAVLRHRDDHSRRRSACQILPEDYPGFLLAILPPGAFFVLGLMIAGRNWLDARANERARRRLLDGQAQAHA